MDDDVAQRPGKADVLGTGGESVVRIGVGRDEDKVLVLCIRDQNELLFAHLLSEVGEVFSAESLAELLEAHFFPSHRFEVDHY